LKQPQSLFFKILFTVTAFAVLSGGFLLAPGRLVAQDSAPAPAATTDQHKSGPTLGGELRPGQVRKEEAEENDVYRHTPLVQSISDAIFHDDKNSPDAEKQSVRAGHTEKTASAFEWINFAIIALAIVIPLAKFVPKMLRKRSETLKENLETARKTTADGNSRLSAVEAQLSRLDDEIAKIRAQVEEESKQDEVRIKATIEEESARIVAAAEQEIGVAAAQARRGLRHFAADLAIEQATKQLVLTPETDRALIAEFVSDVTTNGARKAGQNLFHITPALSPMW